MTFWPLGIRRQFGKKDSKTTAMHLLDDDDGTSLWTGTAAGEMSIFLLGSQGITADGVSSNAAMTWSAHQGGVNCIDGTHGLPFVWTGGSDWQVQSYILNPPYYHKNYHSLF